MIDRGQTPRALTRAFAAAEAPALVAVPAAMVALAAAGVPATAGLTLACALLAVCLVMASFEASRPALRQLMPTAVLSAVAAAGRVLFSPLPDVKPVSAIAIVAGATLGRRSGFVVGALAALLSNVFFGQGPWTPWQMYAWGLAGYGAGLLAQVGLDRRLGTVCAYGFCASLAFGFIMNCWSVLGFLHASMRVQLVAVCLSSLPFDVVHGVSTVVFLAALYAPWRRKLARVRRLYQDPCRTLGDGEGRD